MKYRKEVFRSLSLITQLGINVMVPVFMCIFAGVLADKYLGINIILLMLLLGICAGGRNAYVLAKKVLNENVSDRSAAERKKKEDRLNDNKK